jgi:uncharacterized RDD family membrane protein YckC
MRKIRKLLTPENVFIEYELAGIGSRMIAFAIDMLIQVAIMTVIIIIMILSGLQSYTMNSVNSILIAIGGILIFVVFFGYFIACEMLMNGQSPGKRIIKLKVIRQTGEPINFVESLLRNILRLLDIYLSSFILGPLMIIFTKDCKRVGDLAANTIVVKIRKTEKFVTVEELFDKAYRKNGNDEFEDKTNKFPVDEKEYAVLKEFMERKMYLGGRREVIASNLNNYFSRKFGITNQNYSPYNLFEAILKANSNS